MRCCKSLIVYIIVVLHCIIISVSAKDNTKSDNPIIKVNSIKTNPFVMLWSQIPFSGEARIVIENVHGLKQSSMLCVSYIYPSPLPFVQKYIKEQEDSFNIKYRINGFRVQGAYKFYLSGKKYAPKGWYIGPHSSYNSVKIQLKGNPFDYVRVIYFNVNLISGYQFPLWDDTFLFDIYLETGYRDNLYIAGNSSTFKEKWFKLKKGIRVSFTFNVGIAF